MLAEHSKREPQVAQPAPKPIRDVATLREQVKSSLLKSARERRLEQVLGQVHKRKEVRTHVKDALVGAARTGSFRAHSRRRRQEKGERRQGS